MHVVVSFCSLMMLHYSVVYISVDFCSVYDFFLNFIMLKLRIHTCSQRKTLFFMVLVTRIWCLKSLFFCEVKGINLNMKSVLCLLKLDSRCD